MSTAFSLSTLRQIIAVGPKAMAQRGTLATLLALGAVGTGTLVTEAAQAATPTPTRTIAAQELNTLSVSGWVGKLQREGHSLDDALLASQVYRRLASATIVGRSARLDQDTVEWLAVRQQWRAALEQPMARGQIPGVVAAFRRDVESRSGCGGGSRPTEGVLNTLGFSGAEWQNVVQDQHIGIRAKSWGELEQLETNQSATAWRWDRSAPMAGFGLDSAERTHVQARLQIHANNLGVSWVRIPWGSWDSVERAQSVERGFIQLHAAMQHVTAWSEPAVGLRGKMRWDMSLSSGQDDGVSRVDGGAVWVQAPLHQFPKQWFSAVAEIEPRAQRVDRLSERSRRAVVSNVSLNQLFDGVLRGKGSSSLGQFAEHTLRKIPQAAQMQQRGRQRVGMALEDIDAATFSHDVQAVSPVLFALDETRADRQTHLSREQWAASLSPVRQQLPDLNDRDAHDSWAPSCRSPRMR